jgi:hypothetical protein
MFRMVPGTQESKLVGLVTERACALVSTVPVTNVLASTVLDIFTTKVLDATGRLEGTVQRTVRVEKSTLEEMTLSSVTPRESNSEILTEPASNFPPLPLHVMLP